MENRYDWHNCDPNDKSTNPENGAHVELEFADGKKFRGQCGPSGWFFKSGPPVPESTAGLKMRWRYIKD
jgi:hypothetical protein